MSKHQEKKESDENTTPALARGRKQNIRRRCNPLEIEAETATASDRKPSDDCRNDHIFPCNASTPLVKFKMAVIRTPANVFISSSAATPKGRCKRATSSNRVEGKVVREK